MFKKCLAPFIALSLFAVLVLAIFPTSSPPQIHAQEGQAVEAARWYGWLYEPEADFLHLFNPDGIQFTLARPQLPGEAEDARPRIAVSPDGYHLLLANRLESGRFALGIYAFDRGIFTHLIEAEEGETIGLGMGLAGVPAVGSPAIFDASSNQAAITFSDVAAGTWRVALLDLNTGEMQAELSHTELSTALESTNERLEAALNGSAPHIPAVVFFENPDSGVHIQLAPTNAAGQSELPAFIWYPDQESAAPSPYLYPGSHVLSPDGQFVFAYLDEQFPSNPNAQANAIASRNPTVGGTDTERLMVADGRNISRVQWAASGESVLFLSTDAEGSQEWGVTYPASGSTILLTATEPKIINAHATPDGYLVLFDNGTLFFRDDKSTPQFITNFEISGTPPLFLWVQPPAATLTLNHIAERNPTADLSELAPPVARTPNVFSGNPASSPDEAAQPAATPTPEATLVVHCAGAPGSRLALEARGAILPGFELPLTQVPGGVTVKTLPAGTRFTVVRGPRCHENQTWWEVVTDEGDAGWLAEASVTGYFLGTIDDLVAAEQANQPPTATSPPAVGTSHCEGAPSSRVTVGMTAEVVSSVPLRLRSGPGADFVDSLDQGMRFSVVGGPECQGGFTWWSIQLEDGRTGWSAEGSQNEYFMQPVEN